MQAISEQGGTYTQIELYDIASDSICIIYDRIYLTRGDRSWIADARPGALSKSEPYESAADEAIHTASSRLYPIAWARFVLRHPEYVTGIVSDKDGWRRVSLMYPHSFPGQDPINSEVVFDQNGIVRETRYPTAEQLEPKRYEYDPAYPEELMVISQSWLTNEQGSKWTIVDQVVLPEAPPGAFDFDRLERLAVEYKTNYRDRTVAEVNASRAEAGLDPLPMDPLVQEALDAARGTKSRWRWPLIAGGGIAIAMGLLAMWRRRVA